MLSISSVALLNLAGTVFKSSGRNPLGFWLWSMVTQGSSLCSQPGLCDGIPSGFAAVSGASRVRGKGPSISQLFRPAKKVVSDFTCGRQPTGKVNDRQTDYELLQRYVRDTDQGAFADLLRRHLDLVYGTAMRRLQDSSAVEEVSQNVFSALARKAWRFGPCDSLPAWLHRAALLESKEWLRSELRRRRREQTAAELGTTMKTHEPEESWRNVAPFLDDGLLSLREKDRTALLLRYYENQSLRLVGEALGVSEDAAQKRVAAALQRLAAYFQNRGFHTTTPAIAGAALAHTFVPTPAAAAAPLMSRLARTVSSGTPAILSVMSRFVGWTNAQKGAAFLLLVAGSSVVLVAVRSTDVSVQEALVQPVRTAQAESASSTEEAVRAEPPRPEAISSAAAPVLKPVEHTLFLTVEQAVELLAQCINRTILRHPALPKESISITTDTESPSRVKAALETAFAGLGVRLIVEERAFALLVPTNQLEEALKIVSEIPHPSAADGELSDQPMGEIGEIDFQNAFIEDAARVYGDLVGRKKLPGPYVGHSTISIRTQEPLSRSDAAYAIEVLFAWNGIAFERVGENEFRLIRAPGPGQTSRR